jgi:hypothetical protein
MIAFATTQQGLLRKLVQANTAALSFFGSKIRGTNALIDNELLVQPQ